jgi:hypothetical protein
MGLAQPGAILGEGSCSTTRRTPPLRDKAGTELWQITRSEVESSPAESPEAFYRIVAQIARRLSERLSAASGRLEQETARPAHHGPP